MLRFGRASAPDSSGWTVATPPQGGVVSAKEIKMPRENPSHILKFFGYKHLPPHLQPVSEAFYTLADQMDAELPDCAEKSAGLRKLLEAKDCMVRAAIETKG